MTSIGATTNIACRSKSEECGDVRRIPARSDDQWHEMKPGERLRIQASAARTGGAYVVLEVEVDPGTGVHLHVHDNEDEHFVVVEGTLHMDIDGKTRSPFVNAPLLPLVHNASDTMLFETNVT